MTQLQPEEYAHFFLISAMGTPGLSTVRRMEMMEQAEKEALCLFEVPGVGQVIINNSEANPHPDRYAVTLYYNLDETDGLPDTATIAWFGGNGPVSPILHYSIHEDKKLKMRRAKMISTLQYLRNYSGADKRLIKVSIQVNLHIDALLSLLS